MAQIKESSVTSNHDFFFIQMYQLFKHFQQFSLTKLYILTDCSQYLNNKLILYW